MNPRIFDSLVRTKNIPNEQIETAFYVFFVEVEGNPDKINVALESLKEHRPEIAIKVAQEIVQQTPDEMIEEITDFLAKDKNEKKLAFYIISIWSIHPIIAEKMDKKYSLGIKAIMDESRLLRIYE